MMNSRNDDVTMLSHNLADIRRLAFDAASNGMVVVDLSEPAQPIIDVNHAFVAMTGYSREEAIGRNCRFLQGPSTDQSARRAIRTAIRERRHVTVTLLNYRKDGEAFWNELHLAPMLDGIGHVCYYVGVQTDVTRYHRERLRAELLAEASAILISSIAYESTINDVAALIVPDIADRCSIDVFENGDTRRLVSIGHEPNVKAGGSADPEPAVAFSQPLVARGRQIGEIEVSRNQPGIPFDGHDLELTRELGSRIAVAIDSANLLTDSEAAVRARDQFLSIAAHELRTPISSIKGYAQLLLRGDRQGTLSADRLRRSLQVMEDASDRLKVLTDDLLDVSRIRLGRLPLRTRRIDFNDMVEELIQRYIQTFRLTHHVTLTMADEPCWVDADPDRIQQVVTNMIENAVNHSEEEAPIAVKVANAGDRITFEVVDSGIGLSAESISMLFEPFARTQDAMSLNVPGIGLGLYISRGIVTRHGGEIWVQSEGEGRGARFGFWLPCQPEPAAIELPPTSDD